MPPWPQIGNMKPDSLTSQSQQDGPQYRGYMTHRDGPYPKLGPICVLTGTLCKRCVDAKPEGCKKGLVVTMDEASNSRGGENGIDV